MTQKNSLFKVGMKLRRRSGSSSGDVHGDVDPGAARGGVLQVAGAAVRQGAVERGLEELEGSRGAVGDLLNVVPDAVAVV